MGVRDPLLMVLVAFLWAICFPLIQVGLEGAPPLVFAASRAALAGALVLVLAAWLGRPWPRGWTNLAMIAAIGLSFTGLGLGVCAVEGFEPRFCRNGAASSRNCFEQRRLG
ncbi:hypothetical protein CK501_07740 [Halovibrio salipaludis]|uniref:EamA domain-containing protein n=1 Tax=Halovibrio salipaludis TaxID=2032626 RepID=A0A2A2F6W5_9GAMM|nr:hypothetical protein CK501_07740 [Halovibrio salipaludis]